MTKRFYRCVIVPELSSGGRPAGSVRFVEPRVLADRAGPQGRMPSSTAGETTTAATQGGGSVWRQPVYSC